MIILGGTGHRPERLGLSYSNTDKDKLYNFLYDYFHTVGFNFDRVIAGGAQGFDNSLARLALAFNKELVLALPNKTFHLKWPEESQDELRDYIADATEVYYANPDGPYKFKDYFIRDKYIVDNSDEMITIFDGIKKGGTHITLEYAKTRSKKITNLWSEWNNGILYDLDDICYNCKELLDNCNCEPDKLFIRK